MTTKTISEPRTKGRPSLEEAAEIDRAIREAALQELFEKGEAASVNAVAQAAGLSRKTVYARYSSKSELFIAAVREMLINVESMSIETTGPLEERIVSYVRKATAMLGRPHAQAIQRALSLNPHMMGELHSELVRAARKIFFDPIVGILLQAEQAGELQPGIDCRRVAKLIMDATVFARHSPLPDDALPADAEKDAALIAHVVCRGITAAD
ncbi:TetR/AcrR family transcriptional regulator [Novosphingobium sp. BL-8A]|uniref:TetR/AcrR family transcriptional regulator n=1 Tax=Novosphingobium sp. BL-8A TaxID=3127639 RepID=UPI003757C97C